MGGRGASSGMSDKGCAYGTEYSTLYQSGNIKFVRKIAGSANAPMETMTKGRIYVTVNSKNAIKSVTYYDKANKRYKEINVKHKHLVNGVYTDPHLHKGYIHNEHGDFFLSTKEIKMLDRVRKTWYNINNK